MHLHTADERVMRSIGRAKTYRTPNSQSKPSSDTRRKVDDKLNMRSSLNTRVMRNFRQFHQEFTSQEQQVRKETSTETQNKIQ